MPAKLIKRYVQLQKAVQRVWDIDGYPTYFFDEKGQLYRFTARGDVKPLRRTVKRYTQGYTLKSRFYSLSQLRPMLRRHEVINRSDLHGL
ncbi:hypothetical protein [Spirosoma montaniterrae]|uniref:hypothetical protein n=1 Tax=Spirosoma montaniterrae TaxID=1178516 RepID=UPI0012F79CD8|nr:hypothetical protein [Spirosoma montaniterrae]